MNYSPEARAVLNVLSNFGAISIEQIYKMFDGTNYIPSKLIAFLQKQRFIRLIDDKYAVLQNNPRYSKEKIACLWVLFDRIQAPSIVESQELMTARSAEKDNMTDICFVNGGKKIEYITFLDSTNLAKAAFLSDTFKTSTGEKKDQEESNYLYIFVCKDEDVMEKLAEMELQIPFMVAYMYGDIDGIPSIEYYEL